VGRLLVSDSTRTTVSVSRRTHPRRAGGTLNDEFKEGSPTGQTELAGHPPFLIKLSVVHTQRRERASRLLKRFGVFQRLPGGWRSLSAVLAGPPKIGSGVCRWLASDHASPHGFQTAMLLLENWGEKSKKIWTVAGKVSTQRGNQTKCVNRRESALTMCSEALPVKPSHGRTSWQQHWRNDCTFWAGRLRLVAAILTS
jgi:hypothetical protein